MFPGPPLQQTKQLCVDYRKVDAQLQAVLKNRNKDAITVVDNPNIY